MDEQPGPTGPPTAPASRALGTARWRIPPAAWGVLAVILGLYAFGFFVRDRMDVALDPSAVREMVAGLGIWGPIALIAMMTFRFVVMIPSPILLTVSGVCFGFALGTLYGGIGLLFSALLKLAFAHFAGRELLLEQLPRRVRERLAVADSRVGAGLVGVATSYPIGPAGLLHMAAILSGMSLLPFTLAVGIGSLIRAGTFSLFGNALIEGEGLAVASGVFAAAMLLPLLVPRWRAALMAQLRGSAPGPGPGR